MVTYDISTDIPLDTAIEYQARPSKDYTPIIVTTNINLEELDFSGMYWYIIDGYIFSIVLSTQYM